MDVMNISNRNVVDLSSFFVFEVTGDSESCSNFDSAVTEESSVALDEDDAESCSWDLSTDDDRLYASIGSDSLDHNIGEEFVIDYMEEDDYEDEDEATSDPAFRKWSDSTGEINIGKSKDSHNSKHKSRVSVVSTTKEFESLNEMEKNRLFWETCLAS